MGGTESPIELMWGIGVVNWQKDGRIVDRPLLERRVDIELDDKRGGLIRVRPTGADALFDLKPYEELGCTHLPSLADLIRREIQRASESEGISPFIRESFNRFYRRPARVWITKEATRPTPQLRRLKRRSARASRSRTNGFYSGARDHST